MTPNSNTDLLRRLREAPELLQQAQRLTGSELAVQSALRQQYPAELVRAALALRAARRKAAGRLPCADVLWLTDTALQQSTAWEVARHKARRFCAGHHVLDLCSGIGVDSAALLARGPVTSVDADPAMLLMCGWNLDVWRAGGCLDGDAQWNAVAADVRSLRLAGRLLHVDPDRRVGRSKAARRLEAYCPDLAWMQRLVSSGCSGALKLGPASNFMQKFPGCEIELVSLHGECREATVWFGDLAGEHSYRATHLPSGETVCGDPLSSWCDVADQCGPLIFDPDPAVVRSGLLDQVANLHNLQRLDKEDEYLTGGVVPPTAFLTSYSVRATLPNSLKEVKRYLRSCAARDYVVKCRHLKTDAAVIARKLPRGDGEPLTLFFARINGRARVVVARRVEVSKCNGEDGAPTSATC